MRPHIAISLLLMLVGCTTQRDLPAYVYTPPVVVSLKSMYQTNNCSVLIFTFTNISSNSMSYGGYDREHPVYYYQFKNREPSSNDGDEIVPSYQLAPGQSGTFQIKLEELHSVPFRAGMMMSEEYTTDTSDIYWSPYVTP
jgi:hypothetical protein